MCKRFEKFGINYEKELSFEFFCKIYKYRVDSETLSLDFCRNHLKNMSESERQPIRGFVNSYGIYIPMTRFSHSCAPNTSYIFNGRELQLRAIKPIDVNQEITFSYIPLTIPQIERQKKA